MTSKPLNHYRYTLKTWLVKLTRDEQLSGVDGSVISLLLDVGIDVDGVDNVEAVDLAMHLHLVSHTQNTHDRVSVTDQADNTWYE